MWFYLSNLTYYGNNHVVFIGLMTLTIYDGKHFLWVIERLVVVLLVQMWYIKPIGYLCTVNIFAKAFLGYNCQKVLAPLAFFTAHHSMGIRYPWNTQFMVRAGLDHLLVEDSFSLNAFNDTFYIGKCFCSYSHLFVTDR